MKMEYYAIVIENREDVEHYGILRRSGRYPWGSGKRPYQSGGGPKNETPEQREERKKNVIKVANSAIQISEFANELTLQELDQVLRRLELNRKLKQYTIDEREYAFKQLDRTFNKLNTGNKWILAGKNSLKLLGFLA